MKIIFFTILLMTPQLVNADNSLPPPGYWAYDGEAISFCFQFNHEDICSKLPMVELQKIILESNNKENIISSLNIKTVDVYTN